VCLEHQTSQEEILVVEEGMMSEEWERPVVEEGRMEEMEEEMDRHVADAQDAVEELR